MSTKPRRYQEHQGPVAGGPEEPGEPNSSPSTMSRDTAQIAAVSTAGKSREELAMNSLKRLVRGVY